MEDGEEARFSLARESLRREASSWVVHHVDITCDGCELEPILGSRQDLV
jgi:hypothetical protein